MLVFMVLIYILVLIPMGVMWSGFALSKLWAWFFVPALGVPALSIPAAMGIALVVSYMTHQMQENKEGKDAPERLIESTVQMALKPALALGFGWLIAQWM